MHACTCTNNNDQHNHKYQPNSIFGEYLGYNRILENIRIIEWIKLRSFNVEQYKQSFQEFLNFRIGQIEHEYRLKNFYKNLLLRYKENNSTNNK